MGLKQNIQILQKTITPDYIFRTYPFLQQRNQYMVTHNDYDGILTALILQEILGWKLVGVYDLERLYISESYTGSIRDIVFVDLDVTREGFKSFGHHIIGQEIDSCNINQVFNIGVKEYREKFPLSTGLFIYWLYGIPLPERKFQQMLLLHSDSAWKNYLDYTDNVTNWIHLLNLDPLLSILSHPEMKATFEKHILPRFEGWNHQCGYLVRNGACHFKKSNAPFQNFVDVIATSLDMQPLSYPTDLIEKYKFKRETLKINPHKFEEELKQIKSTYSVFSYSLKYRDTIDISYF